MSNDPTVTKQIIKSYWTNKDRKAMTAKEHNRVMLEFYPAEIMAAVNNSKIYGYPQSMPTPVNNVGQPEQIFVNKDSISALCDIYDKNKNICVLNFASYKHPGGGFMYGSSAQEESLCHETTLYEILSSKRFEDYYLWNNAHKNRGLYTNRAIYSPGIIVEHDDNCFTTTILTCAAPNFGAAGQYKMATPTENFDTLAARVQFIADILEENNIDTFIAGAFGCGVFGQNPNELVTIYKSVNWGSHMKKIIHAVPGTGENTDVFKAAFGG